MLTVCRVMNVVICTITFHLGRSRSSRAETAKVSQRNCNFIVIIIFTIIIECLNSLADLQFIIITESPMTNVSPRFHLYRYKFIKTLLVQWTIIDFFVVTFSIGFISTITLQYFYNVSVM